MKNRHNDERGFALASAILALVVVGALVTAGFFAASQEGRISTSNAQADLAFYVAEQGLQNVLGTLKKRDVRNLADGDTLAPSPTGQVEVGGRTVGEYDVQVRYMGGDSYFLTSTGVVTQGGRYAGATRRLGMAVRTVDLNFPMTAALTTYGGIELRGNATVSGVDTPPAGWPADECEAPGASESGIRTRPEATVDTDGSTTILGDPPIERDESLTPSEFEDFGDVNVEELRGWASHIINGGSVDPQPSYLQSGAVCNRADVENWGNPIGSPTDPCYGYFPIIYSEGDLTVNGNSFGQGILVVNGDFSVGGGFEFYGIVIVSGIFNNGQGSGNAEIHGTLLAGSNASIEDPSEYTGTPVLQFSTCSVTRAIEENEAVARLFPVQKRSWVDLTGAGEQL